jgi:hypothetical protein
MAAQPASVIAAARCIGWRYQQFGSARCSLARIKSGRLARLYPLRYGV